MTTGGLGYGLVYHGQPWSRLEDPAAKSMWQHHDQSDEPSAGDGRCANQNQSIWWEGSWETLNIGPNGKDSRCSASRSPDDEEYVDREDRILATPDTQRRQQGPARPGQPPSRVPQQSGRSSFPTVTTLWGPALSGQPQATRLQPKDDDQSRGANRTNSRETRRHTETHFEPIEDELQAVGPCSNTWTVPALKPRRKKKASTSGAIAKPVVKLVKPTVPKSRGQLLGQDREETALTRQIKACVRCRMQKNRCEPDPDDLTKPCLRCQRLSEPALSVLPCLRYIITDASLYREQEAPYQMFSRRWQNMDILDITDWASDEIREIEISHLFHYAPYRAKMRKFIPVEGDMITEVWTDRQGIVRTHDIPPYAIADMKEHIEVVREFIDRNVSEYIVAVVDKLDPLLWSTYMQAFRHVGTAREERERNLMGNAFRLWAACRSTSNPCRIAGPDTLDVPIVTDPSSPWYTNIPPPPILVAQEECIYYTKLLRPLSKNVLDELQNLMLGNKKKHWLTIYLVTFILLHSCSMVTRRDAECAAQWSLRSPFANPESIHGHHMGALTLLAHFHYSCKGKRPFAMALTDKGLDEVVESCSLNGEERQFVREIAVLAHRRERLMQQVRASRMFGHDYYWTSQLFDTNWEPSSIYV